ncbi:MAG: anti-sigma factor family protein [Steroidobacterales bacterium]
MIHDEAQALLDAYLDDELDLATALKIEAHAHGCPACTAWLAERRSLIGQIHAAGVRYPLPPAVSARIGARLRPAKARVTVPPQWLGALAAGVIVAIGGFLLGHSWPQPPDLRAELVSASVRAILSPHPVDVLSSDHHTVKPWLSSQLPFSPPVPELAQQGDELLGARVDYLGHTRVAALLYQHGRHQINVYVWPRSAMPLPAPPDSTTDGYQLMTARAGAFTAVMVSDLSIEEMTAFRERWVASAAASAASLPGVGAGTGAGTGTGEH